MNNALLFLLFATSLTGLLLMLLKKTPLLGVTLCMPYSKFVHGFYRIVALIADAHATEAIKGKATERTDQPAS